VFIKGIIIFKSIQNIRWKFNYNITRKIISLNKYNIYPKTLKRKIRIKVLPIVSNRNRRDFGKLKFHFLRRNYDFILDVPLGIDKNS